MIMLVINKYDYRLIIINCTGLILDGFSFSFSLSLEIFEEILIGKNYNYKIFFIHLKENLMKIVIIISDFCSLNITIIN